MIRTATTALALLAFAFSSIELHAQPPPAPAPTGPAPTGLVVGSGNYFSPITANLEKAVAFYRDGLGLDAQAAPSDLTSNAPLMAMFGLPDAKLRQQIARTPAVAGGVEIVEISAANGKPVERRNQDPGAVTLVATVRDLDATLARLERLGAPVVTRGGKPVVIGQSGLRIAVVKDPDGHFVEIAQPAQLPETQAPPTQNVVAMAVRVTVSDVANAMSLYGCARAKGESRARRAEWRRCGARSSRRGRGPIPCRFAASAYLGLRAAIHRVLWRGQENSAGQSAGPGVDAHAAARA